MNVVALRPAEGGVLTLDLAGIVGWAYGHTHQRCPIFGRWPLPKFGGEGGRYATLENELAAAMERYHPSAMVIEAPLTFQALLGHSDAATVQQQYTLRGIAYMLGYRYSCPVSEVSADLVRYEILGQSRFPKKGQIKIEVVRWCHRHGMKVPDHNSGDAVLTWEWHRRRVTGRPPAFGPLAAE
jgi:Holliday junction resolvasome RuvABC endonuclease subunit